MKGYILLIFICICFGNIFAAPSQEIPPLMQEAKNLFSIETTRMQNIQGRFYNIHIAIPKHKADKKNVFYTLDGNAFFPLLLNEIATKESTKPFKALPIIIGVGHYSPLAYDRALRTYDYTPLLPEYLQDKFSGGGGIDSFLDFLIQEVKPSIHKRFGVPQKELLFGHSFGGLFVLHTLLSKPQIFTHYVCASPSLWWGEGKFLSLPLKLRDYPDSIIFTRGSLEKNSKKMQGALKLESLIQDLQTNAPNPKNIMFIEFDWQSHGSSVPYALQSGLDIFME